MDDKFDELIGAITDIADNMNTSQPLNDFGMTVGDELHEIACQLTRIADALGKIAGDKA